MNKKRLLSVIKWGGIVCILLTFVAWHIKDVPQRPSSEEGFIQDMQLAFDDIYKMRKSGRSVQETHQRLVHYHVKFSANYPIYYDWWLQDALYDAPEDPHKWYWEESFAAALNIRLAEHKQSVCTTSSQRLPSLSIPSCALCAHRSMPIPRVCRMLVTSLTSTLAVRCVAPG